MVREAGSNGVFVELLWCCGQCASTRISSRRWTRYFAMLLRDRSRMYTAMQRDRL